MVWGQKTCPKCEINGENEKMGGKTFWVFHTSTHSRRLGRVYRGPKGKGKGKLDVGVSNPVAVGVVLALAAEDCATSFQGPRGLSEQHCVQPMRQAKLLRIPIVDSDMEHQLVFPLGNSSSNDNNNSLSNSSSSNSSSSSDSPANDDLGNEDVYISGGSTVSAAGSTSSSSDGPEPQPQPKKNCHVVAHSPVDRVVDVDVMSSDGCPCTYVD